MRTDNASSYVERATKGQGQFPTPMVKATLGAYEVSKAVLQKGKQIPGIQQQKNADMC